MSRCVIPVTRSVAAPPRAKPAAGRPNTVRREDPVPGKTAGTFSPRSNPVCRTVSCSPHGNRSPNNEFCSFQMCQRSFNSSGGRRLQLNMSRTGGPRRPGEPLPSQSRNQQRNRGVLVPELPDERHPHKHKPDAGMDGVQRVYCSPRVQRVYCSPRVQRVYCSPRVQRVYCNPRVLRVYCNPRVQRVYCSPRVQRVYCSPRVQRVYCSPRVQRVYCSPRVQRVYCSPRIQRVYCSPRVQRVYCNPRVQRVYCSPRVQRVYYSPRVQRVYYSPRVLPRWTPVPLLCSPLMIEIVASEADGRQVQNAVLQERKGRAHTLVSPYAGAATSVPVFLDVITPEPTHRYVRLPAHAMTSSAVVRSRLSRGGVFGRSGGGGVGLRSER
ncbi:Histone-lysine N-methyltransferase 2D [Liparis tanakae]|uniref:Histone-lysine N-methyltransferase 2D n=1 Tax=Liparis tanakae TaxID=230148 RepID=A0A4Z2FKA4_9TELE|nr:Histone-lysine N-methyltransferase 2D [Liparis tanakae]